MSSQIEGPLLVCSLICWLCIFLSLFKGIKPLSYIVYPTFFIPAAMVVVLMVFGITMENSKEGFDMYFTGKNAPITPSEAFEMADIWINAVAQVFFSLSLGVGVMTTYSSYNKNSSIVKDALIIAGTDTVLSFLSGFFVFGIVGFLIEEVGFEKFGSYMGGAGLLYGTIPFALSKMAAPNAWSFMFFLTIFLLGIDSSISYVETVVTAINETNLSKKTNRLGITVAVCLSGFLISIAYCCNFSNMLISSTDYFLSAYFITFVAIVECVSIGWIFDFKERVIDDPNLTDPLVYLTFAYWGGLFCFGVLGFWVFFEYNYLAILAFLVCLGGVMVYTKSLSKLSWGDYYEKVAMNGVHRFARGISLKQGEQPSKKSKAFDIWFGISIKYVIPACLVWMLMMSIKYMGEVGKDGYEVAGFKWQFVGMIFPILGLFSFFVPMLKPTSTEKQQTQMESKMDKEFSSLQANVVGNMFAAKMKQVQPISTVDQPSNAEPLKVEQLEQGPV